ncbi:MAG: type II toxin-antitoxin system VapC family toxin [Gemmatimonadota bacterium]
MTLYAESSAVLSWLLGETGASAVRSAFGDADVVLTSEITLIECDRVLIRAITTRQLEEGIGADRRAVLRNVSEHWTILGLESEVVERARRSFPHEPVRTLDALHLSFALFARSLVPGTRLLSLDDRLRACGRELGFKVVPDPT